MSAPMQFSYNSDFPSLPPLSPPEFPAADPNACARITTRVFYPSQNQIETVPNVLVRIRRPTRAASREPSAMDDSSSSSSSDDDSDSNASRMDEDSTRPVGATDTSGNGEERAYLLQRTVREAIYGRVVFAIVLRKRPRDPNSPQQAEWEVTAEHCAVKEMDLQHIRRERGRLAEDPIKEVNSMQYLKKWHEQTKGLETAATTHKTSFKAVMDTNIMMPLDLLSDDRHLYSIMPYCDGGELFERLDLNERFSEGESRYWMFQICNGIENLQHAGICHRDMSLENLLVHKSGCLIIDMGMCLRIPYAKRNQASSLTQSFDDMSLAGESMNGDSFGATISDDSRFLSGRKQARHLLTPQGTCGKWIYMSPEIYKNAEPFDGFAVDMWAAGVILFLMLTGFPPWERACGTDDRFKYMTAGYLVQMMTEWEIGISSDAMDLLQRMLFSDPKDRLSLDQVRAHPWMVNGPRIPPSSF